VVTTLEGMQVLGDREGELASERAMVVIADEWGGSLLRGGCRGGLRFSDARRDIGLGPLPGDSMSRVRGA
jgi:hypothetical protein